MAKGRGVACGDGGDIVGKAEAAITGGEFGAEKGEVDAVVVVAGVGGVDAVEGTGDIGDGGFHGGIGVCGGGLGLLVQHGAGVQNG